MTMIEYTVLDAAKLGIMMLEIEAREHRDNGAIKKAEAVEGAITKMLGAINAMRKEQTNEARAN